MGIYINQYKLRYQFNLISKNPEIDVSKSQDSSLRLQVTETFKNFKIINSIS